MIALLVLLDLDYLEVEARPASTAKPIPAFKQLSWQELWHELQPSSDDACPFQTPNRQTLAVPVKPAELLFFPSQQQLLPPPALVFERLLEQLQQHCFCS